ncbi:MAG: ribulose-phosphate 3-epimerase [Aggregatilineales bacterium]
MGEETTVNTMIQIAPSILAADFTRLGEQVQQADAAGADLIHIDVMDGRFVPNITMGPLVVEAVRRVTDLPLDVHLMIIEPERYIDAFADAGATNITVHIEASPNLHRTLQLIRARGCRAGVAINPHTPASALGELMYMIDLINVMTVNPGFGGQTFITEMTSKIARLRAMSGDAKRFIDIEVDGGINEETAMTAAQAGANILIVGSALFNNSGTIAENMSVMRSILAEAQQ